jgi:hypothetical protein
MMITLIEREFTVNVALQQAWDHLARIEAWPSWAAHIRRVELRPPGELGPQSTGVIHLAGGIKPTFRVTEFNRPGNWKWVSRFLWLALDYDHRFEPLDAGHTKLIWTIQASGLGAGLIGRLFALIYRRHLDRAIPRLVREINGHGISAAASARIQPLT